MLGGTGKSRSFWACLVEYPNLLCTVYRAYRNYRTFSEASEFSRRKDQD
jgi:hypothetical protein